LFASILSWFLSGGLNSIAKQLNVAYQAKLNAQNDHERIAAELDIKQLEARQAVLIAEQGNWKTSWIRPFLAAPVGIFMWKILVYDLVLGLGATDNPSDNVWYIIMTVIGAYFLTRPFEKRR
jgi:hypothetical protein